MSREFFVDYIHINGLTFEADVCQINGEVDTVYQVKGSYSLIITGPEDKKHLFPCIEELTNEFGDEVGYEGIKISDEIYDALEAKLYQEADMSEWQDHFREQVKQSMIESQIDEAKLTR